MEKNVSYRLACFSNGKKEDEGFTLVSYVRTND